jgi:hypothetical protein
MNVALASKPAQAPAHQRFPPFLNYGLFALCAGLYLLPFMRSIFLGTDEGSLLCGGARIAHGQVFARDFFEVMGPGTLYWLAAFFKIFGVTFLASRICLFVSLMGTALTLYFLSRRVNSRYQVMPCLILAGPYFGLPTQGISHHVDSNFFALLSVLCLILWHARPRNALLIFAGILAGAVTCVLQPKGVLLFGALLVWLWLQRRKVPAPLSKMALLAAGYFSFIGLVLAYFWSQGALGSLVYVNFIFPAQHYSKVNVVAYAQGIERYWTLWVGMGSWLWSLAMAAFLILPLLFVAALPLLLLLLGLKCKWKSMSPEIVLLWLCGAALWMAELHRKDIYHLVWGSPLAAILCFHMLGQYQTRFVDITVQILGISAVCLAGFNLLAVAISHVNVTPTPVGNVLTHDSDRTLRFLIDHTSPGENIFVYPYCPTYYFLSGTTNPTPYSLLLYNYNIPSQFQEAVSILDRKQVKYVIWDTTQLSRLDYYFPGSLPKSTTELIVEPYLESHYRLVNDDHGIRILERNEVAPAN